MSGRWSVSGWKCLLLASAISWVAPTSAEAQRLRRFEAGFFLGGMSVDHDLGTVSNLFFTTSGQANDVSLGTGLLGARFSFDFSPNLAAEASYYRTEQTFSFTVEDRETGSVDIGDQFDATLQNVSGNLVAQFPLEIGLVPYGTIGFAWVQTDPKNPIGGLDQESSNGLNLGGGIKYFFPGATWVGARFDLRYQLLSQSLAFAGASAEPRNTEVTIGAAFRF